MRFFCYGKDGKSQRADREILREWQDDIAWAVGSEAKKPPFWRFFVDPERIGIASCSGGITSARPAPRQSAC